jgi:hypothetical protein
MMYDAVSRTVDPALLMMMRRDAFGIPMRKKDGTINSINQAPPKELLKCYGGKKDIESFRSYSDGNDTRIESGMLVAINPVIYSGRRSCGKKKKTIIKDLSKTSVKRTRALKAQRVSNLVNGTKIALDGDLMSFL